MSEPTLERIADRGTTDSWEVDARVIARELIALRKEVEEIDEGTGTRLDALERPAGLPHYDSLTEQQRHDGTFAFPEPLRPTVSAAEVLLQEKLRAVERERDEAREVSDEHRRERIALTAERDAALAKVERMHPYLRHSHPCPVYFNVRTPLDRCTCGLADALGGGS